MNKTLLTTALIAGLSIAAFVPQAARADGTINFTGKVVQNTCSFNVNGSGTANGVVALPVVFTSALQGLGKVAGATPFSIVVSGCDSNLTSVQELFSTSAGIAADGNLTNTAAASTNVEVQLLSGGTGGAVINLATGANSPVGTLVTSGSTSGVTLNYTAQYYAIGNAVSTPVTAVATYVTSYK
jgi:major type 1 subunit fimbrin (pilin)